MYVTNWYHSEGLSMSLADFIPEKFLELKGQVDTLNRCVRAEVTFINQLFGIAAQIWMLSESVSENST